MASVPYPDNSQLLYNDSQQPENSSFYVEPRMVTCLLLLSLIHDVVKIDKIKKLASDYPNAILVPVHELIAENGRFNAIPLVYADYVSNITGLEVCKDIIQVKKASHTNKNALNRLLDRSQFEGPVKPGATYIVVDDVVTQGGTVSELRSFIENSGGRVACVSTVSFGKYSVVLGMKKETVSEIERKFGRNESEKFIKEFGIGEKLEHLTNAEGRYLLQFASIDRIRERISEVRDTKGRSGDQGIAKGSDLQFQKEVVTDSLVATDARLNLYSKALTELRIKKGVLVNQFKDFERYRTLFDEKEGLSNSLLDHKLNKGSASESRIRIRKINILLQRAGFTDFKAFMRDYNSFMEKLPFCVKCF